MSEKMQRISLLVDPIGGLGGAYIEEVRGRMLPRKWKVKKIRFR